MNIPACVAFIPDGNRRWAKQKGLPGEFGHQKGLREAKKIVEATFKAGVRDVVFWGASESNLTERSPAEISYLFMLLKQHLSERLQKNDKVRFKICGKWQNFTHDKGLQELVKEVEKKTSVYDEYRLTLLFGYDGESDVEQATQKLFDAGTRPTKELIRQALWTGHLPHVDLIIRTGVEDDPHESDAFLPLQRKNAQQVFSYRCWPTFTEKHLHAALEEYACRERRRGA